MPGRSLSSSSMAPASFDWIALRYGSREIFAGPRPTTGGLWLFIDAATGVYEDLVKLGVIDAAKVTRSALQNAASIAALFLTTEVVVADKPEETGNLLYIMSETYLSADEIGEHMALCGKEMGDWMGRMQKYAGE